jgi:hypothetical protein
MLIHRVDRFRPDYRLPKDSGQNGFAEVCLKPEKKITVGRLLPLPQEPPQGESRVFPFAPYLPRFRSTGLFYMPSAEWFMYSYERMKKTRFNFQQSFRRFGVPEELVEIISLMRSLRSLGKKTQARIVHSADVIFCEEPKEYEALCRHWPSRGASLAQISRQELHQ